ncbi:MAG: hypothetical protein KIT09_35130 [Bryobacteraceae bacterium]|nr:hypothetical protein [Bryobacteraceae bacterium]
MSQFLRNAVEIFDAAELSSDAGHEATDLTILIGPWGEVSLVAECDWPLDTLQAHRGAAMAFRVSQQDKHVRLEGRAGSRTCLFETAKPNGVARTLLADPPAWLLRQNVAMPPLLTTGGQLLPGASG